MLCMKGCERRDLLASMPPAFTFSAYRSSDCSLLLWVLWRLHQNVSTSVVKCRQCRFLFGCMLGPCAVSLATHAFPVLHTAHLWTNATQ